MEKYTFNQETAIKALQEGQQWIKIQFQAADSCKKREGMVYLNGGRLVITSYGGETEDPIEWWPKEE